MVAAISVNLPATRRYSSDLCRRECLRDISCATCNCSATRVHLSPSVSISAPADRCHRRPVEPPPLSSRQVRGAYDQPIPDRRHERHKSRPGPRRTVRSGSTRVCNYDVSGIFRVLPPGAGRRNYSSFNDSLKSMLLPLLLLRLLLLFWTVPCGAVTILIGRKPTQQR